MKCCKFKFGFQLTAIVTFLFVICGMIGAAAPNTNSVGFTTPAYQNEALRLVIQEANQVARELNLTNELPITKTNVIESFIGPYGSIRYTGGSAEVICELRFAEWK